MSLDENILGEHPLAKTLDAVMKPVKNAFRTEYGSKISEYGGMLSVGIASIDGNYALAARVILPKDEDLAAKLQEENLLPSKYVHKGKEWNVSVGYLSRPKSL